MISVFDLFKIGIGPSSSHTVGPMKAGKAFIDDLKALDLYAQTARIEVHLHGSLALTGLGHTSDVAVIAGLLGEHPETVDTEALPQRIQRVKEEALLPQPERTGIVFDYARDLQFHQDNLPLHENGLRFLAFDAQEALLTTQIYYSIGGGFIVSANAFHQVKSAEALDIPYPYRCAKDLEAWGKRENLRLSTLTLRNESALRDENTVRAYCLRIWQVMRETMQRGLEAEGVLPGRLRIPRRAPQLKQQLEHGGMHARDPMYIIDWVNMVAMAVNEENAAGGRVVTAPTNGACGIVPAVLAYYDRFVHPLSEEQIVRYLLACACIGSLYKMNASISGAEVGCQGEIGVACSMAAAGLTDIQGGTVAQVCEAAEIAMEHHLGLTCDPVAGLVQVPCIERNAVSAVKAINAARMALMRQSQPVVSLDDVIQTMYETGKDMNRKYRETATGGLAVHVLC